MPVFLASAAKKDKGGAVRKQLRPAGARRGLGPCCYPYLGKKNFLTRGHGDTEHGVKNGGKTTNRETARYCILGRARRSGHAENTLKIGSALLIMVQGTVFIMSSPCLRVSVPPCEDKRDMGNDLGREDAVCRFCDRIDIPLLMFFLTFVPLHNQAGKGRCLHIENGGRIVRLRLSKRYFLLSCKLDQRVVGAFA
jgi:hypothetical protein